MARLDLDAARAARAAEAEAKGEDHVLVIGGQEFSLPVEMPLAFPLALAEADVMGGIRELLGEEQYAEFAANPKTRLSTEDLKELFTGAAELYGFEDVGEALASGSSSLRNGKPSRPTSKRSTAKTSGPKSGGRTR